MDPPSPPRSPPRTPARTTTLEPVVQGIKHTMFLEEKKSLPFKVFFYKCHLGICHLGSCN